MAKCILKQENEERRQRKDTRYAFNRLRLTLRKPKILTEEERDESLKLLNEIEDYVRFLYYQAREVI